MKILNACSYLDEIKHNKLYELGRNNNLNWKFKSNQPIMGVNHPVGNVN